MVDIGAHERVVWALRRAFLAVEAAKEVRLREAGVSASHYGLLMNLGVSPGLTGAELARRLGVTPQNVASLVARLEDRGLVTRREHERHAHVRELHLTATGEAALDVADAAVSALESDVAGLLGDDTGLLRDLLDRVATLPADGGRHHDR